MRLIIKFALKEWHASHSRNLNATIANLKNHMAELDGKGEEQELTADDYDEIRDVSENIHSLSKLNREISGSVKVMRIQNFSILFCLIVAVVMISVRSW
jgi:hypothetical protein